MKRWLRFLLCVIVLFGFAQNTVFALGGMEDDRFRFVFGPRVGVLFVGANPDEFNALFQSIYSPDRDYIRLLTQFGVNFEQRIKLGNTKSHFAFQEVLLFGGLDQNVIIPVLATMVGFRSHAGLEIGMGPNFSPTSTAGNIGISVSVAYTVGWTFKFEDVNIPVNIVVDPTSDNGWIHVALLTGFNF